MRELKCSSFLTTHSVKQHITDQNLLSTIKKNYRNNVYYHNTENKQRTYHLINLKSIRPIKNKKDTCQSEVLPACTSPSLLSHWISKSFLFIKIESLIFSSLHYFVFPLFLFTSFLSHLALLIIIYQSHHFQGSLHNSPAFLMPSSSCSHAGEFMSCACDHQHHFDIYTCILTLSEIQEVYTKNKTVPTY